MSLVICLDNFIGLQRFTNQPWSIEYLYRILQIDKAAAGVNIGVPLENILRDYLEGKLKKGDRVVCATGTSEFGAHYTIAPTDGKVNVYGHGYRAGLADIGFPLGPGALQRWNTVDNTYENEELKETVRNFVKLFGGEVDKARIFNFYSCGSGGKPANNLLFNRSFSETFRIAMRSKLGRDNVYVHGIAGAFTKRYSNDEWPRILGGDNLRPALKNSYYSIFQEHVTKTTTLGQVLRCQSASDLYIVDKYLSKLSEYESMNNRPKLSSAEKTTLRKLYFSDHTIVAIAMPNGMFIH